MFQKEHCYTMREHHVLKLHYNVPPDMTFVFLSVGLYSTAHNVKYVLCLQPSFSSWSWRFDDFTTWYICPSRHAEIKRHEERKAQFSLSPSPFAVVWEDVCHRYLFILGRKVLSPHVFSELTNIGLTAANCALQEALCRLVDAGRPRHSAPFSPAAPEATL